MMKISRINREIFRLAGPNILSNISVPLISSVDTALMGHLSSTHLGAVGIGAMLFNFLYWNFGFLRMGTTGLTAQAFGRGDHHGLVTTLGRALFISLCLSVFLLAAQQLLASGGYFLLNTPDSHLDLAMAYFTIRIWAAPATLGLYVMMGWFFGMQNAVYPLILTILINVCNILLSYFLVVHWGWEIRGVAIGTAIAQYFGLALAFLIWGVKYRHHLKNYLPGGFWKKEAFSSFLNLNSNIFIRTVSLSLAFGFFYNRSAGLGSLILDANVVLLQFLHWMSYGVDGFAYAAESLSGKYRGAGDRSSFSSALKWSFFWGGVLSLVYALIYGLLGRDIIRIFTNIQDVQQTADDYIVWMIVLPLAGFASYIWDGIFVGMTAGKSMRNSMVAALATYLGIYLVIGTNFGNHGLWLSLMIFLIARAIYQWYLYHRRGWNLN